MNKSINLKPARIKPRCGIEQVDEFLEANGGLDIERFVINPVTLRELSRRLYFTAALENSIDEFLKTPSEAAITGYLDKYDPQMRVIPIHIDEAIPMDIIMVIMEATQTAKVES